MMMEEVMKFLPQTTARRRVRKRSILLCPGDVPRQVFMVRSGCIKVYRIGNTGEEQVAGFKTVGDMFPECWAFGHTSNTMYYYEAVEDSDVMMVDKDVFLRMLKAQPELKARLFDYMVRNYTGLMVQVSALEQSLAVDKLLMMLYYLMIRHGVEKKPDVFWLNMKLRHATLAGLTGLTRETVTAELGRLKKKGVVNYTFRRFVIYRLKLRDMIGVDAFAEIQLS